MPDPLHITTIFFDLDNTLFDHSRAEAETLAYLVKAFPDIFSDVSADLVNRVYRKHNRILWKKMAAGELAAAEVKLLRFKNTLEELGLPAGKASELARAYLEVYREQTCSCPNVQETLTHLQATGYRLGLLSNGFPEIQERKLQNLKIADFFRFKVYSDAVGEMKPSPSIFRYAERAATARGAEIAYVGDSLEDDILGAQAVGWTTVWFNPQGKLADGAEPDFEIGALPQLQEIFTNSQAKRTGGRE